MFDQIKPANQFDQQSLLRFINGPQLSYEHLDWQPSHSRLEENSTFVLLEQEQAAAVLSVAPETSDFAWLRFFFTRRDGRHKSTFQALLNYSTEWLREKKISKLYSLSSSDWFENLLNRNGFEEQTKIVSLSLSSPEILNICIPDEITIRSMTHADIPQVHELDQLCFEQPWQLNLDSMKNCYFKSAYSSLLFKDQQLLAYQISTQFLDQVHLARLAVHPQARRLGLGRLLVNNLFLEVGQDASSTITVNTQIENLPSLNLYQKLGFARGDEFMPVYCLSLF